jgi:ketosteroid isomerase-like protein
MPVMTTDAVRTFYDDLMQSRFEALEEKLAEDVVFEFPGRRFGGRREGKRRTMTFLRANQRLFTGGLRFHLSWVGVVEDRAVAQWTNEGTTREGIPYTNRGVTLFRLAGDKIVEIQDYLDTETIAETWKEPTS